MCKESKGMIWVLTLDTTIVMKYASNPISEKHCNHPRLMASHGSNWSTASTER